MPSIKWEDSVFVTRLVDPVEAAGFLNEVMKDGDRDLFLMALRDIATAHGGISALAKKTKLSRPSLHRMLARNGNPELASLEKLLSAFGLRLSVDPKEKKRRAS
jgi:probable addiction module antidote protein